jgi:hypothetical protein
MSNIAELHLLKQRVQELEETVSILDRAKERQEEKLRDRLACAFAAGGVGARVIYDFADMALKHRGEK